MRTSVSGGPPEQVLTASLDTLFRCPRSAVAVCVLGEPDQGQLVFSSLDPVKGRGHELARIAVDIAGCPYWNLSPDGSRVALVESCKHGEPVRLLSLKGATERQLSVTDWNNLQYVVWGADGGILYLSNLAPPAILRVSTTGKTRVRREDEDDSGRKPGVLAPLAQSIPQVLKKSSHGHTSEA